MENLTAAVVIPEVEVAETAARRRFSMEYKRTVLKEADTCGPGAMGALRRREGLYRSHLSVWRAARARGEMAGLAPKKRGPKRALPDPRDNTMVELEREMRRWTARAERAEALVDLQKKVSMLLGIALPERDVTPCSRRSQTSAIASESPRPARRWGWLARAFIGSRGQHTLYDAARLGRACQRSGTRLWRCCTSHGSSIVPRPRSTTQLLAEGRSVCSERTLYRILEAHQEVRERHAQLRHPVYHKPELLAPAPNPVWSWDITKRLGPVKWTYYYLDVLLDIFSRHVTGWLLATRERAVLATQLIEETCRRQGIASGQLTTTPIAAPR